MSDLPTRCDAEELRAVFDRAIASLPEMQYASGYPIYTEAIHELTEYISRSPWHRVDYIEDMKEDMRDHIESLPIGKVQSYFTMMIRIDRFSPGGLLGILENGEADRLVRRAEELAATTS